MRSSTVQLANLAQQQQQAEVKSSANFSFFQNFNPDELKALEKEFGSLAQLEIILTEYKKTYWYYRIERFLANCTNIPYAVFSINTSGEGIPAAVRVIHDGWKIPKSVADGIGIPTSIMSTILFMSLYSPEKEAVRATIRYAHRDIKKTISDLMKLCRHEPGQASKKLLAYFANKTILITVSLTGSMTVVMGVTPILPFFPTVLKWTFVAGLMYLSGPVYFDSVMTQSYFDGVDFWLKQNHRSWLLGEIKRGNVAPSLQAALQFVSTLLFRTYPLYLYLGYKAADLFGAWFPIPLVLISSLVHTACVFYPSYIYDFYLQPDEELRNILRKRIPMEAKEEFAHRVNLLHLDRLSPYEREQKENAILEQIMLARIEQEKTALVKQQSYGYVIQRDPISLATLSVRGWAGGYFLGYQFLTPLIANFVSGPVAPIIGISLGVGLAAGQFYLAGRSRVIANLTLAKVKAETERNNLEEEKVPNNDKCKKASVKSAAIIINTGNSFALATSQIGTSVNLPGNNIPAISAATVICLFEYTITRMRFSYERTYNTFSSLFGLKSKPSVAKTPAALFYRSPQSVQLALEDKPNKGWRCWRR